MCRFIVSVNVSSRAEEKEARRRLEGLETKGAIKKTEIKRRRRLIIVEFEHPGLKTNACSVAGWVKDRFGQHSSMLPAVVLV